VAAGAPGCKPASLFAQPVSEATAEMAMINMLLVSNLKAL
jgi:hypothetical protein